MSCKYKYLKFRDRVRKLPFFELLAGGIAIIGFAVFIMSMISDDYLIFGETSNEWGDYIGGISGSLWSLAAFIIIWKAMVLQRKELEAQRLELRTTRKEFANQTKQFEKQNKNLELQKFENTFFQMLALLNSTHIELTNSNDSPKENIGKFIGKEIFPILLKKLAEHSQEKFEEYDEIKKNNLSDFAVFFFEEDTKGIKFTLAHYYLTMMEIIDFVNGSTIVSKNEKNKYYSIIRSQLLAQEVVIMTFFMLSNLGSDLKKVVEKADFPMRFPFKSYNYHFKKVDFNLFRELFKKDFFGKEEK